jgi:hypothetical protein
MNPCLRRRGVTSLPMLLDLLTVFFIVAGCSLLWLNLRPKAPCIVLTKTDDAHQSASTEHPLAKSHPLLDEVQRHLSEADRGGPKPR